MEINEHVINEAIKRSSSCSPHDGFKQLFQEVEKLSVEDILFDKEDFARDSLVLNTIALIASRSFSEDKTVISNTISELASVIAFKKSYLNKAIAESDLKSLLIFLSVNCYLKIKVSVFINLDSVESSLIQKLKEKIIQFINSMKVNIQALDEAPYHEKKSLNEYLEGFRSDDLEKAYQLLYAIERGNGFYFNYLIENLLDFLFQFDQQAYVETILNRKYPHEYILFLESISKEQILCLACEPSIDNKWIIFELIRQIVPDRNNDSYTEREQEAVKNLISKMSKIDFQFFTKTISHFTKSNLFNASLGNVLVELSNEEIAHIIQECFVFDNYNFNLEARTKLLTAFSSQASEEKYIQLIKLTYEKWETFMSNLEKDKDYYQNGILLTDYANYVIRYYIACKTNDEILSEIGKLINILINIDNIWFRNSSHQITIFFLNLSKLYLLSYAFVTKKISSPTQVSQVNELLSNPLIKSRFFYMPDFEKVILTFNNNFGIIV